MVKVKKLTKKQQKKADKIVNLLDELRQEDVHPFMLDGGGGAGLSFIRHKRKDGWEVGEILLDIYHPQHEEILDEFYTPELSNHNKIDAICF